MKCSKCWKREDGCYSGNHREFVDEDAAPDSPCPAMKAILRASNRARLLSEECPSVATRDAAVRAQYHWSKGCLWTCTECWARWATREKS